MGESAGLGAESVEDIKGMLPMRGIEKGLTGDDESKPAMELLGGNNGGWGKRIWG